MSGPPLEQTSMNNLTFFIAENAVGRHSTAYSRLKLFTEEPCVSSHKVRKADACALRMPCGPRLKRLVDARLSLLKIVPKLRSFLSGENFAAIGTNCCGMETSRRVNRRIRHLIRRPTRRR